MNGTRTKPRVPVRRPFASQDDLREELADLARDRNRLGPPIHIERRVEYLALLAVQEQDLRGDLARAETNEAA